MRFPVCKPGELGFYLIVDSLKWIERMIPVGVRTFQLRIKDRSRAGCEQEIRSAIRLAERHQVRLYINDHWEWALAHGAYGVHLGQEDLQSANLPALRQAGLRLGVSTHNREEVARVLPLRPSYIACGTVFPTTLKTMPTPPQGLERLSHWVRTLPAPVVAIGGISLDNLASVIGCGPQGVAVVSAVLGAPEPEKAAQKFLLACDGLKAPSADRGGE